MAVVLRLKRMGSHKRPFYRIVAADSRYQRDGRFLEILGYYDPMKEPFTLEVDDAKAMGWLRNGARMSETVESLLKRKGIVQAFRLEQTKPKAAAPVAEPAGSVAEV